MTCWTVRVVAITVAPPVVNDYARDPCIPSPCGAFSECRDIGGIPSCSCLPTYRGSPPNCRPECTISTECPANMVCTRQRCTDPCPGLCGIMARCSVVNHVPICSCLPDHTGDPFVGCTMRPRKANGKCAMSHDSVITFMLILIFGPHFFSQLQLLLQPTLSRRLNRTRASPILADPMRDATEGFALA